MPKLKTWDNLPPAVRQHLVDRMHDREISIADLNQLRTAQSQFLIFAICTSKLVPGSSDVKMNASK